MRHISKKEMFVVFQASAQELLTQLLPAELKTRGYKPVSGNKFLYAPGSLPVLLVAHVDTVHSELPRMIVYDPDCRVLWSPSGLGADDRAGVLAIMEILRAGLRPYVLFTNEEEKGGLGAIEAAQVLDAPDVRCIVEFDRRGSKDSVFYDCVNTDFERWVNSFGFKTATGSFTDISFLCPEWGIAGVNLSCGYYGAHSHGEYLVLSELEATVGKAIRMLRGLPKKQFVYVERPRPKVTYNINGKIYEWDGDDWKRYLDKLDDDRYGSSFTGYDWWRDIPPAPAKKATYSFSREVEFVVDAEMLCELFGGSVAHWNDWLSKHEYELYQALEDWTYQFVAERVDWADGLEVEELDIEEPDNPLTGTDDQS